MQFALYVRDILRLPIRIVFTSAAQRKHSVWPRFLISRMDAIIATTDSAASHVRNVWAAVPHGVDTSLFLPAPNRAALWATTGYTGKQAIACIGRIRPEKGTDLFVETAMQVLSKHLDVTALVIGCATRRHRAFLADLKNRVAAAKLQHRILFIGEVAAPDLPGLLRALSLLIALPRYEGYGITPLEAMASGVPIIASDTGHFGEFIGENIAGSIISSGDPAAAAKVSLEILRNPGIHQKLADKSVARAREKFDVVHEADGISRVYERLWAENDIP